jgi:putative transcriptional regulator
MAKKALKKVDWKKFDAMTDADIDRQIASNPDAAPIMDFKKGVWVEPVKSGQLRALRRKMKLSQSRFARRFGFRLRTVQEWEQGRRQPEEAARILLKVIEREPAAVIRALAR